MPTRTFYNNIGTILLYAVFVSCLHEIIVLFAPYARSQAEYQAE